MRFSVRVPVLSEQITVTEPRVSTAGSLRIEGPPPEHPLGAKGESYGHHRRQPLGHGGDRQAHGGKEHDLQVLSA